MRLRKKTTPSVRIGDIDLSKFVQDVRIEAVAKKPEWIKLSDAIIGKPHGSSVLGAITVSGEHGQPTVMKDEKSGLSVVIRDSYTQAMDELETLVKRRMIEHAQQVSQTRQQRMEAEYRVMMSASPLNLSAIQAALAPISQKLEDNVRLDASTVGMSRLPKAQRASYNSVREQVELVIDMKDLNEWFAQQQTTEVLLKKVAECQVASNQAKERTRSMQDEAVRETSSALVDLLQHLYATKWLQLEQPSEPRFDDHPEEPTPRPKKNVKRTQRGE